MKTELYIRKDPTEVRLQNNTSAKLSISKENKKTGIQVLKGVLHPGFEVRKFSNYLEKKKDLEILVASWKAHYHICDVEL